MSLGEGFHRVHRGKPARDRTKPARRLTGGDPYRVLLIRAPPQGCVCELLFHSESIRGIWDRNIAKDRGVFRDDAHMRQRKTSTMQGVMGCGERVSGLIGQI